MAGHSHWAKIKRAKGANDAKRGKVWSKIARKIIIAAKNGGDPRDNLNLRYTIDEAKAANMPRDTIEKAIKKGTGELGAENYEPVTYEAYAPGGVAMMSFSPRALQRMRDLAPLVPRVFLMEVLPPGLRIGAQIAGAPAGPIRHPLSMTATLPAVAADQVTPPELLRLLTVWPGWPARIHAYAHRAPNPWNVHVESGLHSYGASSRCTSTESFVP